MLGSSMLLFFIVPFEIIYSAVSGAGDLVGIDLDALIGQIDPEMIGPTMNQILLPFQVVADTILHIFM
ncbi:MAG: hypothetical protein IIX16_06585 [Clostridia bacterium]|nr:hypothetical protein [Clostridia bacterium]